MNAWMLKLLDMHLYKKVSVADALVAVAGGGGCVYCGAAGVGLYAPGI